MKLIKIINIEEKNNFFYKNKCQMKLNSTFIKYYRLIILVIIILFIGYLFLQNKNKTKLLKDLLKFKYSLIKISQSLKNDFPYIDKDLIGLYYPEINFDKIKQKLKDLKIIDALFDLIKQLETKLIYLEKEINVTKLVSFYTSRKIYLKNFNLTYNEFDLTELHKIVNWIIIHKSDQLKGIASDKYLACKYVELKLGKNLCQQRVAIYNKLEEINYNELKKYGDIVLKISNSCYSRIFIPKNATIEYFNKKMKKMKLLIESEHGLIEAQFFHLYAKKRIIVEKQFIPLTDLYEFKFFIINNRIKFVSLWLNINMVIKVFYYDSNYNLLFKEKNEYLKSINITSFFKRNIINQLETYAIKLSEDFPNFIRVDLYLFHNKIYFSELTFAHNSGKPRLRNEKFILDAVKNFSLKYNYY